MAEPIPGLNAAEAAERLEQFGPNSIAETKHLSGLWDFLARFKNPLIAVLAVAAFISYFLGDRADAVIILVIILTSVILDFANTYRSQKAAEELKAKVQVTATVRRDGTEQELPLRELVPDDIVILTPGDVVPADGVVVEEKDFFANESSLTGESFPAEKLLGEEVYMGSSAVTGRCVMKVTRTGARTKFSHIAAALAERSGATEFETGIRSFSGLIMRITFVLVILIFFINAALKHSVLESFLFAAALAVGLTPELLPMIIALNLSRGSLAMAKRGVIVKRLASIQNFGSMDILCTDKTGTLTEDKIALVKYVDGKGAASEEVLRYAYISSSFGSGFTSPLDKAIKEFEEINIAAVKKIDEVPFDYLRRRDSIVAEEASKRFIITKGSPEELIELSEGYGSDGGEWNKEIKAAVEKEYQALSEDGFRVLGVAVRAVPVENRTYTKEDETGVRFIGFMAFLDPAKASAAETLKRLEHYGIEIKILTGDNDLVTQKICRDLSLPVKGVVKGSDIEHLTDAMLLAKAKETTIFARVSPDQKERIIHVLRGDGHVVGYLGDGINDAPPLKAADVSISVQNAVDVAKDTADLILMQKSLANLIEGVVVGRETFANTLKYLMMALSSNFGNMFSMAGASLLLPFLPMTPTQILLNNLLYDTSQFAIPEDSVDKTYIAKPRKFDIHFLRRFMLVFGPLSSIFDFLTFGVLFFGFGLRTGAFQTGWFLESIATQTLVVYFIRTRKTPFLQSSPSGALVFSTLMALGIGWAIIFTPLAPYFNFAHLNLAPIAAIIAITIAYLIVIELAKRQFYHRFARS